MLRTLPIDPARFNLLASGKLMSKRSFQNDLSSFH